MSETERRQEVIDFGSDPARPAGGNIKRRDCIC